MAKFVSRYASHILVVEPADYENGKRGKRIEFVGGRYDTDDKKETEFLRKHRDFGVYIFEEKTEETSKIQG